jgi:transcriptional regulator with XRE-family HTH domain
MTVQSQEGKKRYANNLRMARVLGQLSQEDLAARIKVDPSIVGRIERGVIRGTPEQRSRLAQVLDMPEDHLFPKSEAEEN